MKTKFPFYAVLMIIPITAFILMAYSGGAPSQGVTGSPADNANASSIGLSVGNCTACHDNKGNFNASVAIASNIPAGGYEFSKKYHFTVTPSATGAADYGFQITAENQAAAKVGIFSLSESTNTIVQSFGKFMTHSFAGHENITSWEFDWTAPGFDVGGPITFYVASVAGNGGSTNNTQVSFATLKIDGVLGVNKANMLNFTMYPNPSRNYVNLQLPSGSNQAKISVFDYLGKQMIQKNITSSNKALNISNLKTGVYFVRVQTDNKVGTKKLIVN